MNFKTTIHYPAHRPDPGEIQSASEGGVWKIQSALIAPPESQHAVPGLVIIWVRQPDYGGGNGESSGAADLWHPNITAPTKKMPLSELLMCLALVAAAIAIWYGIGLMAGGYHQ